MARQLPDVRQFVQVPDDARLVLQQTNTWRWSHRCSQENQTRYHEGSLVLDSTELAHTRSRGFVGVDERTSEPLTIRL